MTLIQPKLLVVIFKKKVKLMTKGEMKSENLWDLGIMAAGPFLAGVLDGIFLQKAPMKFGTIMTGPTKKTIILCCQHCLGIMWDKMLPCATKSGHY